MLKIVNRNNNWHQNKHKLVVRCYCTNETKDDNKKSSEKQQSNFDRYVKIFPKIREQLKNKDFQQYLRLIPKVSELGKSNSSTALAKTSVNGFAKVGMLDVAKSKLYEIQNFYDEFSGMSEVKEAHKKVIDIQVNKNKLKYSTVCSDFIHIFSLEILNKKLPKMREMRQKLLLDVPITIKLH